ncbi:MAG: 2-oxoglutarate dehydrogenase complex dihydrolipoyllysine-residue succinyltransferase [Spirochaetaceae bacterium]|nr:MAG: 2-oxoglutarate dehydrogenase complex dihydrolipoyllysine-residue succinyltransferase [Spirochaetaceae bacterium]
MMHEVQVPQIGESISSGILASWLKKSGEMVEEGEELFELETDKATMSVPSPASGVLSTSAAEGEEVQVGQTVAKIDTEASAQAARDGHAANGSEAEAGGDSGSDSKPGNEPENEALSPAVRRIIAEHDLDASRVKGSGKDGRITKEDALEAAAAASRAVTPAASPAASPAAAASSTAPAPAAGERQTRKPMSNLRKRIATNLVSSKQTSAHLTTFNEVDMSRVMELRSTYKSDFEKRFDVKLGFMSFFVTAAVHALQHYPEVNAFIEGEDILYNNYYHVGVALSSEKGLITPVVKDADSKSFADIEAEILGFITRAASKKIKPDELSGGTFTISNGGVFGSMLSTPIPSPPQSAVLGMHSIQKRAVVVEDEIVIRPMMYLALTYDHRIVDGREAIGFLNTIKNAVEDPARLLLGL